MIKPQRLFNFFKKKKINFFTGVPDSILKELSPILEKKNNHVIAPNEGSAVGIASGYFLSTRKIPCVYLQNSGLGNAINPLSSISHSKVYSIPMLLLIGWRGSPGLKDEPQHEVKGKITKKILNLLGIRFCTLESDQDFKNLNKLINYSKKMNKVVGCLIKKNVFSKRFVKKRQTVNTERRIDYINELIQKIKIKTNIISTTGYTSRELNLLQKNQKNKFINNFYMVGGMGHSGSVSLGISLHTKSNVICLDGDGSLIMHLGSTISNGFFGKKNFKHILFNNNSHESVGGQSTNIDLVNFKNLSLSVGYKKYFKAKNLKEFKLKIIPFLKSKGPTFFEIKIPKGSVRNLTRPKNLLKIKREFMKKIK